MSDQPERWCRICGAAVECIEFGTDFEIVSCQSPTHNYVYEVVSDPENDNNDPEEEDDNDES